ncbi:phosphatidylethanolamine-binding protein [Phakopsora pachyrhizi]|uniref:Phosphatidylethanolamine-binding protein n=1 Tax=Phakopsora pachyrhizi TaxID=170000 RepID=A0A0S1MJR3_PHAPC|nr:phosphatidylethanolamine-binding protein [Phakopsora pachyrhizi]CAH7672433.1 phosphatidylethanolamine-binding protein [Phakopsora pachyrhizi]CAH7675333.1 phosphatidylethanolamine-binding protein [Phakopsora pachyrhizi]
MFKGLSLAVLSIALRETIGQATTVSTDSLNAISNQFDSSYLSSQYPDGFGIPLKAQAILNVNYPFGNVQLGKAYNASDVANQPTISISPLESSQASFKAPSAFTLMLADANALGNPDPKGNYRHFLENGVTFGDPTSNGTMSMNPGSGTVVTSYAGPGPLPNEGPHRYAWLLFNQPGDFQAPSNLSSAGVSPGHWYVNGYVSGSKLGDLVAASFFTVENGHANFTPKPLVSPVHNGNKTNNTSNLSGNSTNSSGNAKISGAAVSARVLDGTLMGLVAVGLGLAFV